MEQNLPARDLGAENPNIAVGPDYEYDEAHDVPAGLLGGTPAPHRVNPPPMVNLREVSELGRTGRVANGVAKAVDERGRTMYWEIRRDRRPQHVLQRTVHDGTPYWMRVAIIIRVGRDGLITRVDEYFDRATLDPLQKQEPSRR